MAGDDVIANPKNGREIRPTVRFYGWRPTAVSLGVHQLPEVVDLAQCAANGWEVVRRPTGGRALLHNGDLSYSVTLPGGAQSPHRLKDLYVAVAMAWIAVFRKFGLKADLAPLGRADSPGRHGLRDGLCLDSRVRGELVVGNRKITAAAQRIFPKSILQHGSVTLTGDVAAIASVLPVDSAARSTSCIRLRQSATSLLEAAGREISPMELVDAALEPFAENLNMRLLTDNWHDEELDQIASRQSFHAIQTIERVEMAAVNA